MEIISKKEAKDKGLTHYFTGKPCRRGHVAPRYLGGQCVSCLRQLADQRRQTFLENRKEFEKGETFIGNTCKICNNNVRFRSSLRCVACRRNQNTKWRKENPERKSKWYEENKTEVQEYNENYRKENSDKVKELSKNWKLNNREHATHMENLRRAKKLNATPLWADLEKIKEIYLNCPKSMSVDHIIPLQGKLVCGLHVENNLQYLSRKENSSKNNNYVPEIINVNSHELLQSESI